MSLEDRIRLPQLDLVQQRPRLIEQLTSFVDEGKRLISVYAPGGYGKSIMLANFAQAVDQPVCWCSIEPSDRDPAAFLTLLAYSITNRFRQLDRKRLMDIVARSETPVTIRRIGEMLAQVPPHLIIVDDYHKAVSAGMTLALDQLLDHLPQTSTLVIAARGNLGLETDTILDLIIEEKAIGLSEVELRFTPDEIKGFINKQFGQEITAEQAEQIAAQTDGNIAQVLLTGHVLSADQAFNLGHLGDSSEAVYGYLAGEVFEKQPPDTQDFLLRTSVLPDMTADLCNQLLGIDHAAETLRTLWQEDLFLTQTGDGYRYHDLFLAFLREQLQQRDAELQRSLSYQAAELLAAQDRPEEAINLYLEVAAWPEAATLLQQHGDAFYNAGRTDTLAAWLAQVPSETIADYPRMLLLQGRLLSNDRSKLSEAMDYYRQAEARFSEQGDQRGRAEAEIYISANYRMMGRPAETLAAAQQGLARLQALSEAQDWLYAVAVRARGRAYSASGDKTTALDDLRHALEMCEQLGNIYEIAMCRHDIGICLAELGKQAAAEHHYKSAIRLWEQVGNANDLINTINSLGVSLHAQGNYDEALIQYDRALDLAYQVNIPRRIAFIEAGVGDVHQARRSYHQAIEAYETSLAYAAEADIGSLQIYDLVKMGECYEQMNDLQRALTLASRAKNMAVEFGVSYERGLALLLQGRLYLRQEAHETSFQLFEAAVGYFDADNMLALIETHLWWGYGLLQAMRTQAALAQVEAALRPASDLGDSLLALRPTLTRVKPLLSHFMYHPDVSQGTKDGLWMLLRQTPDQPEGSLLPYQIFAFGPPLLVKEAGMETISKKGHNSRLPEFLLYLLLEQPMVGSSRDTIVAALWPDQGGEPMKKTFHQVLRRTREALGSPEYIITNKDQYRVDLDYMLWCDAVAFEALLEQAATAPPEEKLAIHLEIIALYRGEFLKTFELSPEWGDLKRVEFEQTFLQVVHAASEMLLAQNRPDEALQIAEKGLSVDNLRDELHRVVLQAHAQANRVDQVEIYYQQLVTLFEEEFGTPPPEATIRLYQQLTAQKQ